MDRVVRHAIQQGLAPIIAFQMATINTAEHFGLDRELGQIAPGRYADILLLSDLDDVIIDVVIAKGKVIAEHGKLLVRTRAFPYPEWATRSVKLKRALVAEDFVLPAEGNNPVRANVIGVIENHAPTRHLHFAMQAANGQINADMERDIAKIALVERHRGTGAVQVGLVHGFGLSADCALASTVAHDSHHMLVVGTSEEDMALAANELEQVGGGQIVVRDGQVLSLLELPIAGLMSDQPAEIVAQKAEHLLEAFRACGCELNNPNMQLSLLALVVIPELRISDLGLVDTTHFEFIPVLEPEPSPENA
jgi:adenine deaminase